ncbi:MAG: hypothetical protein KKE30_04820 [Gammaproteobacteria bacterium]|nr:hypothetical protein [Gammaproteobacteria bacterium]MBU1555377.1 hypothetical protein [Gammaproteobacteria bacterium]MBU2070541.1 hypothetical protein [Gammaproteobacteria bacterium]MBU2185353.1 hypothetical protein [Gammaproteobacteria bacterium]MBU2207047.1 hypothetical protein [Gammaproteobacteria bacterium]
MTIAPVLEQLKMELARDPYRFDLVIQQLLHSSVTGCVKTQQQALDVLKRLPDPLQFVVMAEQLQTGQLQILFFERYYLLAPVQMGSDAISLVCKQIDHILDFLLQLEPAGFKDLLVIQLMPGIFSFLDQRLSGVAYVQIEHHPHSPELVPARIAHELAHVVFPCKNRVLSEGIALYLEWSLYPAVALLGPPEQVRQQLADYPGTKPKLELLMSAHFDQDVLFKQTTRSTAEQQFIYQAGFLLIATLVATNTVAGIATLVRSLADPAAEVLPTYLSLTSPPKELALSVLSNAIASPELADIELLICQDRLNNTSVAYQRCYAELSKVTAASSETAIKHLLLLARLLLSKMYSDFHQQRMIEEFDTGQVKQYSAQLQQLGWQAESAYLNARLALLYAFYSEDFLQQAQWFEQVVYGYEAGLASPWVGSEAHLDYASFCLHTPVNIEQNRQRAAHLLSSVKLSSRFQAEVQRLLQRCQLLSEATV